MAPGCFTMEQQQQNQQNTLLFGGIDDNNMLIINESSYNDLDPISSSSVKMNTTNSIPLPSTPYPYEDNEEEYQEGREDQHKSSPITTTMMMMMDTVDSFEILEQTIMKQKRLGRSKNVDLRKKILLKRTFDLVCEIMDHENGFEDTDDKENVNTNTSTHEQTPEKKELSIPPVDNLENVTNLNLNLVYLDQKVKDTNSTSNYPTSIDDALSNKISLNSNNFSSKLVIQSKDSSLAQLDMNKSSQKRKRVDYSHSNVNTKKMRLERRPSNSDEDDEEEESEEEEDVENYYGQQNYICLFDDDNDPFGIADVVNFSNNSSFKL